MCLEFCSVDLKVFFAGLPPNVFDSLSDAQLFSDVYNAVAYPTLPAAISVALSPAADSSPTIQQVHSIVDQPNDSP